MKLSPPIYGEQRLESKAMLVRWEKLEQKPFKGPVSTVMTVSKETGVVCYVESADGTWFKARLALPSDFQMPL